VQEQPADPGHQADPSQPASLRPQHLGAGAEGRGLGCQEDGGQPEEGDQEREIREARPQKTSPFTHPTKTCTTECEGVVRFVDKCCVVFKEVHTC